MNFAALFVCYIKYILLFSSFICKIISYTSFVLFRWDIICETMYEAVAMWMLEGVEETCK